MSVISKYVIDTNTLLSAVISPDGNSISAKAYHKALENGVILASDETFAELVDVIFGKDSINILAMKPDFHF